MNETQAKRRERQRNFFVSDHEQEVMRELAAAQDLSVSQLLRHLIRDAAAEQGLLPSDHTSTST